MTTESGETTEGLPIVQIVKVYPTAIWIESDMMGARHVMMQHEGCDVFAYASFHYDYRYTSNGGTWDAANRLAVSLGAPEPVEQRASAALEDMPDDLIASYEKGYEDGIATKALPAGVERELRDALAKVIEIADGWHDDDWGGPAPDIGPEIRALATPSAEP